jgi:hypothetical protein
MGRKKADFLKDAQHSITREVERHKQRGHGRQQVVEHRPIGQIAHHSQYFVQLPDQIQAQTLQKITPYEIFRKHQTSTVLVWPIFHTPSNTSRTSRFIASHSTSGTKDEPIWNEKG